MRIVNLIENTEGRSECLYEHGLSFYIETEGHKTLLDLGQTDNSLRNAESLRVDLKSVDTVVLSHGHYDHSGGIIPFTKINDHAVIYMQSSAGGDYYADDGKMAGDDRYRYIGLNNQSDLTVKSLSATTRKRNQLSSKALPITASGIMGRIS